MSTINTISTTLILASALTALTSLTTFTLHESFPSWLTGSVSRGGSTLSVSEMILESNPGVQARGMAGVACPCVVMLAYYCSFDFPRLGMRYKEDLRALRLSYASMVVSVAAVIVVVCITYRMDLLVHFGAALIFFVCSTLTVLLAAYMEVKRFRRMKDEKVR